MRTIAPLIIIIMALSYAHGQTLSGTTYIELTRVNAKSGISIGIVDSVGIEYGGFYQDSRLLETVYMRNKEKTVRAGRYEKTFWGAYLTYPIVSCEKADIKLNIRTGVVNNGESFIITPSLVSHYKLNQTISFGAGIGVRAFAPTIQTRLAFHL